MNRMKGCDALLAAISGSSQAPDEPCEPGFSAAPPPVQIWSWVWRRLALPASKIGNPLTVLLHRRLMVSLKGVAFALGGVGLCLFIGGVVWALTAQSPCPDHRETCPTWETGKLLTNIMFLWIGGMVLEFVAVIFLVLHFRDARRRPQPVRRIVTVGASKPPSSGSGPTVSVTRRQPPR